MIVLLNQIREYIKYSYPNANENKSNILLLYFYNFIKYMIRIVSDK